MIDRLRAVLARLGFQVQDTSFKRLVQNPELAYLESASLPENEAYQIVKFFPHFFVMHTTARPGDGTFFVVPIEEGSPISPKARKIYSDYFPRRIMVVSENNAGELWAEWFHDPGKGKELEAFVKAELHI